MDLTTFPAGIPKEDAGEYPYSQQPGPSDYFCDDGSPTEQERCDWREAEDYSGEDEAARSSALSELAQIRAAAQADAARLPFADGATFRAHTPQSLEVLAYDRAEDLHILTDETGAVFTCDDDTSFRPILDVATPGVLPLGLLIEQRAAVRFSALEAQIADLARRLAAAETLLLAQARADLALQAWQDSAAADQSRTPNGLDQMQAWLAAGQAARAAAAEYLAGADPPDR